MKTLLLTFCITLTSIVSYAQESLSASDYVIAGQSQLAINNYSRATEYFTNAITLDKSNIEAYIGRATAKGCTKDYYGAVYDLEMALKLNPKNNVALFKMGLTKYQLGAKDVACQYWKQANELGNPDAYKYTSKYCY